MAYQDLINGAFKELSHRLVPSEAFRCNGNLAVNKIFDELRAKSRFNLSRVYICGSAGKKTAIFDSDFDCIIFVNVDHIGQIEKVLNDFEDILMLANFPKLKLMRKTKFSIQFQYDGFDMDFLPAIDFVTSMSLSNPELGSEQAFKTLECIYQNKDKAYYYSSALAETQLAFMRQQSPFIHDLVRLCKLWNKSLLIDDYISGRSTLIELIATHAGRKEENRTCIKERVSLLSAFNTFLKLMENFSQLRIEFDFDPLAPLRSIDKFAWLKQNDDLKRTTPFVIEPANPFNNLAKGVKPSQKRLFQLYATETCRRLNIYVTVNAFVHIPLDQIFEPQPTMHGYMSEEIRKLFLNANFLVSSEVNTGPSSPTMTIRNEENYKKREMQLVLKHLQIVFSVIAQGFVSSKYTNQSMTATELCAELKQKIKTTIDMNILDVEPRTWISSTNKHENEEVTFSIPSYMMMKEEKKKEEKFCAFISFTLK